MGAGPYLAVGVGGKATTDGKSFGVAFHNEKSIEFSNDDPTTFNQEEGTGLGVMKRFDYGANGVIGISEITCFVCRLRIRFGKIAIRQQQWC